jgi:hypothetical protein
MGKFHPSAQPQRTIGKTTHKPVLQGTAGKKDGRGKKRENKLKTSGALHVFHYVFSRNCV